MREAIGSYFLLTCTPDGPLAGWLIDAQHWMAGPGLGNFLFSAEDKEM